MEKAFVVSILNQKLTLKSDSDDRYLNEIVGFVSHRVEEVMKKSKTVSTLAASLLTCLNIADELFRSKKAHEVTAGKATAIIQEMIDLIELAGRGNQKVL